MRRAHAEAPGHTSNPARRTVGGSVITGSSPRMTHLPGAVDRGHRRRVSGGAGGVSVPLPLPRDDPDLGRVMDDLKKLSVERLRELARKHLGKGHSRLRTRAELVAALKDALREPLSRLLDAAESVLPHARKK